MTESQIEAFVDASAAALGLPLAPEHLPGVLRYIALAAQMAELVHGLPLATADEPAETFVPVAAAAPSPAGRGGAQQ